MKAPSYKKDMRQRAKCEKKFLVSIDFVTPSGKRELFSQMLLSRQQAVVLRDAWLLVMTGMGKAIEGARITGKKRNGGI